jgi:hypothetical protein
MTPSLLSSPVAWHAVPRAAPRQTYFIVQSNLLFHLPCPVAWHAPCLAPPRQTKFSLTVAPKWTKNGSDYSDGL